jgi:hypothetical protein
MIKKGPGWSHSLHLIELFPDLTNLLKIDSAELAQNIKTKSFLSLWSYSYAAIHSKFHDTMRKVPHVK